MCLMAQGVGSFFRRHLDYPQSTTQLKVRVLNVGDGEKMKLV